MNAIEPLGLADGLIPETVECVTLFLLVREVMVIGANPSSTARINLPMRQLPDLEALLIASGFHWEKELFPGMSDDGLIRTYLRAKEFYIQRVLEDEQQAVNV